MDKILQVLQENLVQWAIVELLEDNNVTFRGTLLGFTIMVQEGKLSDVRLCNAFVDIRVDSVGLHGVVMLFRL